MKLFAGSTINLRKCLVDTYEGGLSKPHEGPATFTSSNPETVSVSGDVATLVAAGSATITAVIAAPDGSTVQAGGSLAINVSPLPTKIVGTSLVDVLGD